MTTMEGNLSHLEILKDTTDAEHMMFYMNTYIPLVEYIECRFPGRTSDEFVHSFPIFFMSLTEDQQLMMVDMHNQRQRELDGTVHLTLPNVQEVMSLFEALDKDLLGIEQIDWDFLGEIFKNRSDDLVDYLRRKVVNVKDNPSFKVFVQMDRSARKTMIYWMHRRFHEKV